MKGLLPVLLTDEQRERIEDFVAVLRSGEYTQRREILSSFDATTGTCSYCCQGVALERYASALGYDVWRSDDGWLRARDPRASGVNGSALIAPRRFWHDMGMANDVVTGLMLELPDGCTTVTGDGATTTAVSYVDLNDNGFTFEQIADLLEWQFLR